MSPIHLSTRDGHTDTNEEGKLKLMDQVEDSEYRWSSTYKCISIGNLESSGGICPLIELLFM